MALLLATTSVYWPVGGALLLGFAAWIAVDETKKGG